MQLIKRETRPTNARLPLLRCETRVLLVHLPYASMRDARTERSSTFSLLQTEQLPDSV
jgi:hypothetical protein